MGILFTIFSLIGSIYLFYFFDEWESSGKADKVLFYVHIIIIIINIFAFVNWK